MGQKVEFQALVQRALEVRQQYAEFEKREYGRPWTREELVQGLVGDVGDLVKLAMAHSGIRNIPNAEQKLAHELADCLWSILVLAESYGVDIEQAFLQTMNELEQSIASQV